MFPDFTFDKNVKFQNLAKNHEKSGKNCKISRKFPKFRIYLPGEFSVHFNDSNFIVLDLGYQKIELGGINRFSFTHKSEKNH